MTLLPETIADNVKRLREIYTGNRANLLEIKTINALVELVGDMHEYITEDESDSWMPTKLIEKAAPIAALKEKV